jgi:PLP dependent protein
MTSADDLPIATALHTLRQKIAAAAKAAGRDPASIELLAVSKTQGPEPIEQAIAAGQSAFGENRVQEAAAKYPPLKARYPNLRLHLIGPLQTNKARDAVRLFDVIETLDRPRLAEALAAAMPIASSPRRASAGTCRSSG